MSSSRLIVLKERRMSTRTELEQRFDANPTDQPLNDRHLDMHLWSFQQMYIVANRFCRIDRLIGSLLTFCAPELQAAGARDTNGS